MAEYAADSNQQLLQQIAFGEVQIKPEAGERTECRKGSWTLHETVVLIAAKKLDDDRRLKLLRAGDQSKLQLQGRNSRPRGGADQQQVRWKWVENYCWKFGCLRNQNQCSDKWDNLLRDYKKVRDYEELRNPPEPISYWKMEKHERKEKGLPSNLLKEVYCAIQDVVGDHSRLPARKLLLPTAFDQIPAPVHAPGSPRQHFSPILQIPATSLHSPMQKQHAHEQFSSEPDPTLSGKRFLIPYFTSAMVWCNGLFAGTWSWTNQLWLFQSSVDLTREFWKYVGCGIAEEGDESSFEDAVADQIAAGAAAAAKRRKVHANNVELEGSAAAIAPSMFKSTVEIMQTLLACEDKKDRRHRDLLGVEERKLHIEEAKTEISRAGVAGLITAVNTLASAILLLAADTTSTTAAAAALDHHVP
jgi:hypothetical protein